VDGVDVLGVGEGRSGVAPAVGPPAPPISQTEGGPLAPPPACRLLGRVDAWEWLVHNHG